MVHLVNQVPKSLHGHFPQIRGINIVALCMLLRARHPERDIVKIKLRRDTTLSKSDLYEFKMALFDNGNPQDFSSSFVTST